jgi:hypothetical protein
MEPRQLPGGWPLEGPLSRAPDGVGGLWPAFVENACAVVIAEVRKHAQLGSKGPVDRKRSGGMSAIRKRIVRASMGQEGRRLYQAPHGAWASLTSCLARRRAALL